jgi:hypothetical protein
MFYVDPVTGQLTYLPQQVPVQGSSSGPPPGSPYASAAGAAEAPGVLSGLGDLRVRAADPRLNDFPLRPGELAGIGETLAPNVDPRLNDFAERPGVLSGLADQRTNNPTPGLVEPPGLLGGMANVLANPPATPPVENPPPGQPSVGDPPPLPPDYVPPPTQEVGAHPVPPGSSPVQQAFQPQAVTDDPKNIVARFETGGVKGDPYFTPNGAGSGAFGRYQITPGHYARLQAVFPQEGLPSWEEFKKNPTVQDKAMDLSTRYYQNEAKARGHEWNNETLLGMHFLGVEGYSKMAQALQQNPNAPVSTVVSQAAIDKNGNIFKDEKGNVRTVADAVAQMRSKFGTAQPGALSGVKGGQEAATGPQESTPSGPSNPYRDRLQSLLTEIEGERKQGLDWGEILFRMGSGILSGKNLLDGMGKGGALTAEYLNQNRNEGNSRDRALMSGYGALSREKDQSNRDSFGRGINVRWWEGEGADRKERIGAGRMINGEPHLQNDKGAWVPAFQVTGTSDMRYASLSETEGLERGAGDIPNATSVVNIGGVDVPNFEFRRESDSKNYGFGLNGVMAQRRLTALERKQGFDPTRLTAAIAEGISARGPINPAQIANLAISDDEKEYAVSALAYINAVARRESGAQINADEWQRYAAMFMPRFGESPDLVQRRNSIRSQALLPIIAGSGPGSAYLGQIANGSRNVPENFNPIGDSYIGSTTTPGASQGGSEPPKGEGTKDKPIAIQGPVNVSTMDDSKHYRSPRGVVKTGKEWKALAASKQ